MLKYSHLNTPVSTNERARSISRQYCTVYKSKLNLSSNPEKARNLLVRFSDEHFLKILPSLLHNPYWVLDKSHLVRQTF